MNKYKKLKDYYTSEHLVYRCCYHVIFCPKYRHKILVGKVSDRLKEICNEVSIAHDFIIEEIETDKDHVHIMFKAHPKTELTKFINAYKSASSRLIKRDFPRVKQFLWKEQFWSKSFCLLTTGGAPIDVIKKYIQNQGNNHK